MKKTILFSAMFLGSLVFAQKANQVRPGDGRDAHGCSPSAGQTYSQIQKKCLQSFAQKIRLIEQNPTNSWTSQTGVVFSKDMKKAEIFIADGKENSMILTKKGKESVWEKGDYALVSAKNKYELRKNNVVIYK
ncbi:hypothetical protein [Chryseobacterium sp. ERMR1:04]|uniref:hypothetical protein n=1 Tax=Chryseobacterium sp. ERMR1:04 TaxID=1705393 RepID=UPI0006C8B1A9|nr:hypothetical protein [Chryseobacterium sp. ERMR1:04]KPH14942.1 hypothetical protein AMQ68_05845 [Chryseobacterium sp. ERMR1:04]